MKYNTLSFAQVRIIMITMMFGFCTLSFAQQDPNDWLSDKVVASIENRYVDYEEMIDVVLDKKDQLDPMLRGLAYVEIIRSEGNDNLTIATIDKMLNDFDFETIKEVWQYLIDTKVRLLILNNKYKEIWETADFVEKEIGHLPEMKKWVTHYKELANAGQSINPVIIHWNKDRISIPLENNLTLNGDSLPFMTIRATFNGVESDKLFIDTGMMTHINLTRKFAQLIGVKMLPDSIQLSSANNANEVFYARLGILDSLRFKDVTLYNLPVYVTDEEREFSCVIGTPDLARFGYIELSNDSLILQQQHNNQSIDPNFTMNPGTKGTKCICIPCMTNGEKNAFILDTGSNGFLLHNSDKQQMIKAEVGGMKLTIAAGLYSHSFVSTPDAVGFWGIPILWAFKKICIDFNHQHIDFIKKEGQSSELILHGEFGGKTNT